MMLSIAAAVMALQGQPAAGARPWEGYNEGVRWEKSLDDARVRAAREGKPILFYQLVGDLDKEGC